jgi:two-component system, LytTR family, sensor histidine kinase AlgZ
VAEKTPATAADDFYLPDFCASRAALVVVLIVALVALMLTLANEQSQFGWWLDLARRSMFLLWAGLASAGLLCWARPRLKALPLAQASVLAVAIPVLVTAAVCLAVVFFRRPGGFGLDSTLIGETTAPPWLFVLRNVTIALIVTAVALRYFYAAHHWRRNVEMDARSRIDALQARIRPHFLFNSMNTIASLTRTDPKRAEEAIEDLADLFRVSLSETRSQITLKEELEVARIYLGERLKVDWQIADLPLRSRVPSLIVQPLLENAIYHGIEPLPEGGTVTVIGSCQGENLEIAIVNPCAPKNDAPNRSGNRIALGNVRERLELAFGTRGALTVEPGEREFRVTLKFPTEL